MKNNTYFESSEIMRELTLTVKIRGLFLFGIRLKIGVFLLRLAAKIIGCKIDIKID